MPFKSTRSISVDPVKFLAIGGNGICEGRRSGRGEMIFDERIFHDCPQTTMNNLAKEVDFLSERLPKFSSERLIIPTRQILLIRLLIVILKRC